MKEIQLTLVRHLRGCDLVSTPGRPFITHNFLRFSDNNFEGISRAYDNLGRVYAKMGKYSQAVDCWMEKLPLCRSALESTWIHHEIGRGHLELKNYQDAKEFGQKSLVAAQECSDRVWQLNAKVLVSQAEGWLSVKRGQVQLVILRTAMTVCWPP